MDTNNINCARTIGSKNETNIDFTPKYKRIMPKEQKTWRCNIVYKDTTHNPLKTTGEQSCVGRIGAMINKR